MSDWNANIIEEFRANEGLVSGMFEGAPMLLLHATGNKRSRAGESIDVPARRRAMHDFASKGGHAERAPHWLLNLEADPHATIEVGTETVPMRDHPSRGTRA